MIQIEEMSYLNTVLNTGDGKAHFQEQGKDLECDEVWCGYLKVSKVKEIYLLENLYIDFGTEDWNTYTKAFDNYQELMEKINEITQETLEKEWR